ncbi:hypothetical protein SERLADRAFT_442838 [Serpula lacrymans var. lacrymans S7.9]|uniref:ferric-chelate reductase (NADPH) n=1 Tax=Serpula lacrymans var. lacrymans (strain S7.9) TaxID=578457 RepID=F8PA41_SERL9|nr:uncharacterized protein SERLADRAFT_442838 [Serpula lacrymans var. lacrymans S7.9]EGO20038.1 hypothetical protein SERLADRAFT_442838 [Serpula lacrymans var. lacrymans S7.9]
MGDVLARSTAPTDKTLRVERYTLYPEQVWYLFAVFIFVVGVFQWGSFLHSKFSRRHRRTGRTINDPELASTSASRGLSLRRIPLALTNAYRVVAFRWTLEIGSSYTLNMAEVFVTIAYIVMLFIWAFINTTDLEGHKLDIGYWSNRAGYLAASQFPMITALGTKNNLVSLVTGISYDKLNYVHRMMARVVIVLLWVHGGSEIYNYKNFLISLRQEVWLQCGLMALIAFSLLCVISIRPIRSAAYELFFYAHLTLVLIFLLGAYFHTKGAHGSYWVWPSFVFWALDRFVRVCRLVVFNHSYFGFKSGTGTMDASTELLSDHFVRLRLRRPPHFHWTPGQTAYLIMPSVSQLPFEAHPFTIASFDSSFLTASSPDSTATSSREGSVKVLEKTRDKNLDEDDSTLFWKELVFLINVRGGFTKRLKEVAAQNGKVKVFVDGPYGPSPELGSYDTSVLISGGSGVSFTLPVLLDIIERVRNGKSDCRRVVFIWSIREASHVHWIDEALIKAIQLAPPSMSVSIHLYITGVPATVDPLHSSFNEDDSIHSASRSESGDHTVPEHSEKHQDSIFNMAAVKVQHGRADLDELLKEEVGITTGRMSCVVRKLLLELSDTLSVFLSPGLAAY